MQPSGLNSVPMPMIDFCRLTIIRAELIIADLTSRQYFSFSSPMLELAPIMFIAVTAVSVVTTVTMSTMKRLCST